MDTSSEVAKKTTLTPSSASAPVSNGTRGVASPSGSSAADTERCSTKTGSTSGCPFKMRSTSAPPYPVNPTIPVLVFAAMDLQLSLT